ncbi:flagellar hook-basal body complex protein FliE [Vagococcus sp.]|uniref:flagellar hook-basal body complex protein FliE n=1 Tax=Vagococcus sp. TaxID=1933889 RepID=UPI003F9A3D7F
MNIIQQNPLIDYQEQLKGLQPNVLNEPKQEQINQKFSNVFDDALGKLEEKVNKTETNIPDSMTGKAENMHDIMIDMTEAQLSVQTAVQIRNKLIDSVNELKNMQF